MPSLKLDRVLWAHKKKWYGIDKEIQFTSHFCVLFFLFYDIIIM